MVDRVMLSMLVLAVLAGALGCAAAPERSTVLQAGDLIATTDTMVQALAGSPWLAGRTPETRPEIVLRPDELRNLSDTRLSPAEQWVAVSRVVMSPAMLSMFRERAVIVQMPPRPGDRAGLSVAEPLATITPTHTLRPTLRSLTRAASVTPGAQNAGRKDVYLFEYSIIELANRSIVWSGSTELARVASGSLVD